MTDPLLGDVTSGELHVMTWNVRRRTTLPSWRPADRWSIRGPRVAALLRAERPALLGTQEVLPDQAAAIRQALGATYEFIGHGRSAGPRGEACPIFYDTERLELREWRQRALSERPDVAGSTSWGSAFPRVWVRARFIDRVTGTEFVMINTHLDVFSARARLRGADLIRRDVVSSRLPSIVVGDLNAGPESAPARMLRGGGVLVDAWTAAEHRASPGWATYGGYRPPRRGARIDAMLLSPNVRVPRIAVDGRAFGGGWPSDHLPLQAHLQLPTIEEDR